MPTIAFTRPQRPSKRTAKPGPPAQRHYRTRSNVIWVMARPGIGELFPPAIVQVHACPGSRCPICQPDIGPMYAADQSPSPTRSVYKAKGRKPTYWTESHMAAHTWSEPSGIRKFRAGHDELPDDVETLCIVLD